MLQFLLVVQFLLVLPWKTLTYHTIFPKLQTKLMLNPVEELKIQWKPQWNQLEGKHTHIITGAAGYLAKELCHTIIENLDNDKTSAKIKIIGLVRKSRIQEELAYWKNHSAVNILDIDDLSTCLASLVKERQENDKIFVHCVASNFKPAADNDSESNIDLAQKNVDLFESVVETCCFHRVDRVVLTSSMAAVRGPGQTPSAEQHFTAQDWNTVSTLQADSFASCYQWSKVNSERRAWEVVARHAGDGEPRTELVSLCPSMLFGPIRGTSQIGYSVKLVQQWLKGERPVQSRLILDVRDAALAHLHAAYSPHAANRRFIVSQERRQTAEHTLQLLRAALTEASPSATDIDMSYDGSFSAGAVPIGEREVSAEGVSGDLGVSFRDIGETLRDMVLSIATLS